jgi:fructose-1,6-bisphosphatase
VLDLVPSKIHERAPIYIGCKRDVEIILKFLAENPEGGAKAATTA